MGDWPTRLGGNARSQELTVYGVTAHASANTKGAWTELIAAAPYNCTMVFQTQALGLAGDFMLDFAIGAGESEVTILENVLFSGAGNSCNQPESYNLPIIFPAGQRISCRVQTNNSGSRVLYFDATICEYLPGKTVGFHYCVTYQANTADTGGLSLDPGGSAWAWSDWFEFSASTTRKINAIKTIVGGQLNTDRLRGNWKLEVGIGADSSEVPIVSMIPLQVTAENDTILDRMSELYPVDIPVGTRLSVRVCGSLTDATDRKLDVILYCFE
jgi:hypothetical protein